MICPKLHTSFLSSPESTLADVAAAIGNLDTSQQTRRNMASAINTICKVLGQPADSVPAYVPSLRALLAGAHPHVAGVSVTRWRNAKSDLNRAFKSIGLITAPAWHLPMDADWEPMAELLELAVDRSGLRRFGRFCTKIALTPRYVGDETVGRYLADLQENRLSKTPERAVKDLIRLWNSLAQGHPELSLPHLSSRSVKRSYVLPWSAFPDDLHVDMQRFRERSLNPDWFEDEGTRSAVRLATADQRDRMLRRLASAEVLASVDPATLLSLAQVCSPANLRRGLEFMMRRNDGKPNKQIFEMAMLAQTVARHWADLPDEELKTICKWVRKFRPARRGMTEKNRQRLRQFTGDDVIRRLVMLPEQIFTELVDQPVTPTTARLAQRSIMLALLTVAPMRLKNLRALDRTAHFRRAFSIDENRWHLVLPAAEVKNSIDLEYPIPPHLMAMIDHYLAVYQPLLAPMASASLFPGRVPGSIFSDNGIRRSLMGLVDQRLGLTINPHLFRHLGALLFLKANPGQHETVRQLLGHKNIQTTTEFYSGFETDEAMRRFATVLTPYRDAGSAAAGI